MPLKTLLTGGAADGAAAPPLDPALLRVVAGDADPEALALPCALDDAFLPLAGPLLGELGSLGRASVAGDAVVVPAMLRGLGEVVGGRLRGCW